MLYFFRNRLLVHLKYFSALFLWWKHAFSLHYYGQYREAIIQGVHAKPLRALEGGPAPSCTTCYTQTCARHCSVCFMCLHLITSYSDPRHRYYCYSHFPGGNPSSDCLGTSTVTKPVKEAKPSLPDHKVLALCPLHRTPPHPDVSFRVLDSCHSVCG